MKKGELSLNASDNTKLLNTFSFDEEQFNLTINREFCSEQAHKDDCEYRQICFDCLDATEIRKLQKAFQENTRKRDWNRIFPSSDHFNDDFIEKLSLENQMMTKWYRSNCAINHEW